MRQKHNAWKLLVDLTIPIVILTLIGGILWVERQGYRGSGAEAVKQTLIDQDSWEDFQVQDGTAAKAFNGRALLITDQNDEESMTVAGQVAFVLRSFGVDVVERGLAIPVERADDWMPESVSLSAILPKECADVILCTSSLLSSGLDAQEVGEWVRGGGALMVAAGLEAEELNDGWLTLLGATGANTEKAVNIDSMLLASSILAGAKGMEFSDEVILCESVDVTLNASCTVHVQSADEKRYPLLWEHAYGQGTVMVCNADLMDGKTGRGLIAACFARMREAYAYPVINAAVYCIDDFPSAAPAGFDSNVLSQYGYTIGDFYANIWWPSLRKLTEQYGVRYSTFLIQCYEGNVSGPFANTDNLPSASYYARQILEDGGEIGLHGYNHQPLVLENYVFDEKNGGYTCWPTVENMLLSVRAALDYAAMLSDDLTIQAYVAPSNVLSGEAMSAMIRRFEDMRIYAGVYIGTEDQLVQEFAVLDDAVVSVPRLTADMQMEDSEWWLQVNELNYHFYESNYIHPDDILDEDRSAGGDFSAMLAGYEQMVMWNKQYGVQTCTISQAAGAVQRYCNVSLSQHADRDGITIHADGLIDKAYLMLRTDHTPVTAGKGFKIEAVDEGCWLVELGEEDIRIDWEAA